MTKKGVVRVSFTIQPELLRELDSLLKDIGYDRSRTIQLAIRNFITEYRWSKHGGSVVGALLVLYEHTTRGIEEFLTDIQHEHEDAVKSSMHIHLDEENCLEIIAVKGNAKRIKEMMDALMARKGVKQVKLAVTSV